MWYAVRLTGKEVEYRLGDNMAFKKGHRLTAEQQAKKTLSLRGNKYALGYKHTPETKAKLSTRAKGNNHASGNSFKLTPEQRAKISEANRGRKPTPETKAKIGAKSKGRMLGYKHTPEAQVKMTSAQMGNKKTLGYKHTPGSIAKRAGQNSYMWRGGTSNEPYPVKFNNALKELIRERDGYICQMCPKTQEQNGRALDVHHVDFDKDNLDPKNLVSLCVSCHTKLKANPFFWSVELRNVS